VSFARIFWLSRTGANDRLPSAEVRCLVVMSLVESASEETDES